MERTPREDRGGAQGDAAAGGGWLQPWQLERQGSSPRAPGAPWPWDMAAGSQAGVGLAVLLGAWPARGWASV